MTFRCLGRRVCFVCLNDVAGLTGGYPSLQALISVRNRPNGDREPAPESGREGVAAPARRPGALITVRNVGFCRPCAVGEIERLLEA